jgi:ribulose-5-phosphate 4-epimerase/fuculose-1-phosphate aldolase
MMAQHGVLVVGDSVAQCLDDLYYFEKAADTYLFALATGRPLNVANADVAEKTARQWENYPGFATRHLAAIRHVLNIEDAGYAA